MMILPYTVHMFMYHSMSGDEQVYISDTKAYAATELLILAGSSPGPSSVIVALGIS